jgi:hypothetical protein
VTYETSGGDTWEVGWDIGHGCLKDCETRVVVVV